MPKQAQSCYLLIWTLPFTHFNLIVICNVMTHTSMVAIPPPDLFTCPEVEKKMWCNYGMMTWLKDSWVSILNWMSIASFHTTQAHHHTTKSLSICSKYTTTTTMTILYEQAPLTTEKDDPPDACTINYSSVVGILDPKNLLWSISALGIPLYPIIVAMQ